MDYVVFRIAESYYKQIPDTDDRDLQGAAQAIKYYKDYISIQILSMPKILRKKSNFVSIDENKKKQRHLTIRCFLSGRYVRVVHVFRK